MAPDESSLSKIVPVLLAGLICDIGVRDPNSGKKNLIGIFDKIITPTFPTHRALTIYCKLTDAEGKYHFEFEFAHVESGRTIRDPIATREPITIPDRSQSYDFLVPTAIIEIPEPGRYEFRIRCNKAFLGAITLDVDVLDSAKGGVL